MDRQEEKQLTYLAYDDQIGAFVVCGDMENLLAFMRSYAEDLEDGEQRTFDVKRQDMTQAELDAAPEVD